MVWSPGSNLEYAEQAVLDKVYMEKMVGKYETLDASAKPTTGQYGRRRHRICKKVSATAPGDRDGDLPVMIGDICIHYNAAGAYQAIYVATGLTLDGTFDRGALTWTALTVAST